MRRLFSAELTTLLSLLLLLAGSPGVALAARDFQVEEFSFDDVKLLGVLTLPETATEATPAPLVILIHHQGRTRDTLLEVADAFVGRGFAVLLMDQRGQGQSSVTAHQKLYVFPVLPESHIRRGVADQLMLAEEVSKRPEVDGSRRALVGFGVGGQVAAEAAWRDPKVGALVVVDHGESVAGLDPALALARYGPRPALVVSSSFPDSAARAQSLAMRGSGERRSLEVGSFEAAELLLVGKPGPLAEVVTFVADTLDHEESRARDEPGKSAERTREAAAGKQP